MWFGQQFTLDEAGHTAAVKRHGIVGEKHENVYTGMVNSGIYAAVLERGDVLGLYCGHDHINSYSGNYYGIELGYSPGTGFNPYGLPGAEKNRMRGARVFTLDEGADGVYTGSEIKFARDYGIDTSSGNQPGEPAEFPSYVK